MQKYLRIRRDGVNERQMSAAIKVAVRFVRSLVVFKMSHAANVSHRSRPFWPFSIALFILILTSMTLLQRVSANPLLNFTRKYENSMENSTEIPMVNLTGNLIKNWTNSLTDSSMDGSTDYSTEVVSNTDV